MVNNRTKVTRIAKSLDDFSTEIRQEFRKMGKEPPSRTKLTQLYTKFLRKVKQDILVDKMIRLY